GPAGGLGRLCRRALEGTRGPCAPAPRLAASGEARRTPPARRWREPGRQELAMQELAEFKQTARAVWAAGDYDAMMRQEGLYEAGARPAGGVGAGAGEDGLDPAGGTGNAAIPAARAGASVTGLDLTPAMLEAARARGKAAGATVEWVEGDAEHLPFDDRRFDVILSTFGCMFAPRHEVVADEIGPLLRPRGRLGGCAGARGGRGGSFFRPVAHYH